MIDSFLVDHSLMKTKRLFVNLRFANNIMQSYNFTVFSIT